VSPPNGPKILDCLRVTVNDVLSRYRQSQPAADEISERDLYLSPHFDDICFSLGAYVGHRRQGILLTVFSNSTYVAKPDDPRVASGDRQALVSALRCAEDLTFAQEVGLRQITASFDEAPIRGRDIFDTGSSVEDAATLNRKLFDAIMAADCDRQAGLRPWLYCPMGIGGHVDHVTILRIVMSNYDALRAAYRIAYYEDLFYAADWPARISGLNRFRAIVAPLQLRRSYHLIDDIQCKLKLVRLYESQFVEPPTTITPFTPAQYFSTPAHEAIWTVE
jgi:hypothetical protein